MKIDCVCFQTHVSYGTKAQNSIREIRVEMKKKMGNTCCVIFPLDKNTISAVGYTHRKEVCMMFHEFPIEEGQPIE